MAVGGVVVYHAGGLHEGVADGWADEAEAAVAELAAHFGGLGGGCGDFVVGAPGVFYGGAADELPDVGVEGGMFLLGFEEGLGVADGGGDFLAVADYAGVG